VNTRKSVVSFVVAAIAGGGLSAAIFAADPVHDRHAAMEAVGDAQKALSAIAKKEAPFDAAVVGTNAGIVADKLQEASALFPAGSEGGRSKPEVWSDREAFEKMLKDSQAAAAALKTVKDEAAFGPAFQTLAVSCKSCHEKYRAPRK
jgi:cytochrome c556